MTRACSGPTAAATTAAAPQARTNQKTVLWCVIRRNSSGGTRISAQISVIEECLAAAPEREERISPAVLQQQAG